MSKRRAADIRPYEARVKVCCRIPSAGASMRSDFGLDVVRRPIKDRVLLLRLASLPPAATAASYEAWIALAARSLRAQAKGRLAGPLALTLHIEDRHPRRDAAFAIAPVAAALVAGGVLADGAAQTLRSVKAEFCAVRGLVIRIARAP